MTGKELFQIWAPPEAIRWTRYAKPSLFVRVSGFSMGNVNIPSLPMELFRHRNDGTAFIVDLPGALGIEGGLALAELGLRPVPLYNGVNETNIGGMNPAVDNKPIEEALVAGSHLLKNLKIHVEALPVFLLDYNRDTRAKGVNMYDNRWNVEPDDFPDAMYMKHCGVRRVAVWTMSEVRYDLLPIINNYRSAGIEIVTFCDATVMRRDVTAAGAGTVGAGVAGIGVIGGHEVISPEEKATRKKVRDFENGRFALLLIAVMALVNFIFMFFIERSHPEYGSYYPLLWTTPAIKWLTYVSVSEFTGDIIAIIFTLTYIGFYFFSQKYRRLMTAAFMVFSIDAIVLFIYVLSYGIMDYIEYDLYYGAVVYGFPIFCMVLLTKGFFAQHSVQDMSDGEYNSYLDKIDGEAYMRSTGGLSPAHMSRRRNRLFRGYRGYGGSGLGGYGRGGRGGYGGGGFGG